MEEAKVMDGGTRFVVHGQVTTADGRVLSWTEDYDWTAPSPGYMCFTRLIRKLWYDRAWQADALKA